MSETIEVERTLPRLFRRFSAAKKLTMSGVPLTERNMIASWLAPLTQLEHLVLDLESPDKELTDGKEALWLKTALDEARRYVEVLPQLKWMFVLEYSIDVTPERTLNVLGDGRIQDAHEYLGRMFSILDPAPYDETFFKIC